MADLHAALVGTGKAALNQVAALSGLGGIGKTQAAVEYAYRYVYDTPTYEWAFWVKANSELSIVTDLAAVAHTLNLGDGTLDEMAARSRHWLETHDRWLLIFDNADDPAIVKPVLPRNPQGRVLLTSRAQRFTILGIKAPIAVRALSIAESIAFLCDRTRSSDLDAADLTATTALASELGGLPLALEQAAAYIDRVGVSFVAYWKHYQQKKLTLLETAQPETGEYPFSVATTWLLNFEKVEERSPASIPILQLSAVLAPNDIPEMLLLQGATELGLVDCTNELALGEQLAALADFSLIQRDRETASYSIHRMVQAVIWERLRTDEQQTWIERAITGLNAVFPDVMKFENWAVCGQLVPHVQAIAYREEFVTVETVKLARILNLAGYYLGEQCRFSEAEPLYGQSLNIYEQNLSTVHPHVATVLNNLGALYEAQGRYIEAEPLYQQSLYIRKQELGVEHLDVATSLNNLAALYQSQGRYTEAEPLFQQSLTIRKQQLGFEHFYVASTLNNLAALYEAQGRYIEAEPLYERALVIYEQQLDAEHPDIATTLNNLAELYRVQRRYTEAEPLYQRSLKIREKKLGVEHLHVAISLNNLALLYDSQGRYSESESLRLRCLEIEKQILGEEHPQFAISLNNLAGLYQEQGRFTEAEQRYLRALSILTKHLGRNHPKTKGAWGNFATFLSQVIQAGQTAQLSQHPLTQELLRQIQDGDADA